MDGALVLLGFGFAFLICGGAGLVRPDHVPVLGDRWTAAIAALFSLPLFGASADASSSTEGDNSALFLLLWLLISSTILLVRRSVRLVRDNTRTAGVGPLSASFAGAWRDLKAEWAQQRKTVGASGRHLRTPSPPRSDRAKAATRPTTAPVPEYDEELLAFSDNEPLRFVYSDQHGVVTERTIVKWEEFPGHVEGVCTIRRATRTFRKDRVEEWLDGSDELLARPWG